MPKRVDSSNTNFEPSDDNQTDLGSSSKRFKTVYATGISVTNLARSNIATGTANHVLINDGTGAMSSEATLSTSRGGFGQSMSAATGYVKFGGGNVVSIGNIANSDTTATSSNVASAIVARSASNQITVGVVATAATSNQLILGVINTTTITAPAPSASRVVTIPDGGTNSSFVLTEGAQTINGSKTFVGSQTFQTNPTFITGGLSLTQFARTQFNQSNLIYAGNTTITAAMILGGLIQVGDGGASFTATTDTATNIVNSIAASERAVNVTIPCFVVNNSIRNLTSITGGTGVSIACGDGGNLNATSKGRMLYFTITDVATPTITVYG